MRAEITTRLDAMDERLVKMDEHFVKMDERFVKMDERLVKIEDNQGNLLKNLPIFEKAGDAFELIVRQELRKQKGEKSL